MVMSFLRELKAGEKLLVLERVRERVKTMPDSGREFVFFRKMVSEEIRKAGFLFGIQAGDEREKSVTRLVYDAANLSGRGGLIVVDGWACEVSRQSLDEVLGDAIDLAKRHSK